jgi:hypothetical protein
MSEPHDMSRDQALSALYRDSASENPPPELDAAILAAARREVSARPRIAGSPFSRSWALPVGIAAVIVMSASLVMLMQENPEDSQPPPPVASQPAKSPERRSDPVVPARDDASSGSAAKPGAERAQKPRAASAGHASKLEADTSRQAGIAREMQALAPAVSASPPAARAKAEAFPGSLAADHAAGARQGNAIPNESAPAPIEKKAAVQDQPITGNFGMMQRAPETGREPPRQNESLSAEAGATRANRDRAERPVARAAPSASPPPVPALAAAAPPAAPPMEAE